MCYFFYVLLTCCRLGWARIPIQYKVTLAFLLFFISGSETVTGLDISFCGWLCKKLKKFRYIFRRLYYIYIYFSVGSISTPWLVHSFLSVRFIGNVWVWSFLVLDVISRDKIHRERLEAFAIAAQIKSNKRKWKEIRHIMAPEWTKRRDIIVV